MGELTNLTPGTELGPYKIIEKLGAGGMGEVYRARDTRLDRIVALKVLPEHLRDNPQLQKRFEREARAVSSLNHPHICTLHDIGSQDGIDFLVLELVEGETLQQRLKKGPLPLDQALEYAGEIADALAQAHEQGVLHRDLKPGNIMLTRSGTKLLDFGLAKLGQDGPPSGASELPTETVLTGRLAGGIMGTPAYMAPEQARGEETDKRADIWAFGVVLYEMLAGERLFAGKTAPDTLVAVLTREIEWHRAPVKAHRLLRQCLERDPRRRLRDIGDAMLLLEDAADARTTPRAARTLPWIVAGVLAAALGGAMWMLSRSAPPDRPLMRVSVDLGPEAIHGAILEAAISPDGTRLVFLAHAPDGRARLAVRPLQGSQIAFLAGTENAVSPFFSPDGEWIGFQAGGKFKKVPVQGGAVVAIADAPANPAFGVSWDDHQNVVFSPGMINSLVRVPVDGERKPLTKAGERGDATHRWPQLLPGGGAALFTSHKIITGFDDATIEAVSVPGGERKTLVRGGYFGRYVETGGRGYLLYVREGALFAVRFDPRSQTVLGTPVPVLDDIAGDSDIGAGQFNFANNNGTLIYRSGAGPARKWPISLDGQLGQDRASAGRARRVLHHAALARWKAPCNDSGSR